LATKEGEREDRLDSYGRQGRLLLLLVALEVDLVLGGEGGFGIGLGGEDEGAVLGLLVVTVVVGGEVDAGAALEGGEEGGGGAGGSNQTHAERQGRREEEEATAELLRLHRPPAPAQQRTAQPIKRYRDARRQRPIDQSPPDGRPS
jgi:hypothetical protein